MHFRFSVLGMLLIVFLAALMCAMLRYASEVIATTALTITIFLHLSALVAVIVCRGERRQFWAIFCVFGGGYWLICFGPGFDQNVAPRLYTTYLLNGVAPGDLSAPIADRGQVSWDFSGSSRAYRPSLLQYEGGAVRLYMSPGGLPENLLSVCFIEIGHSFLSLLLGLGMAFIVQVFLLPEKGPRQKLQPSEQASAE